jgi:hypothetical protein
LSAVGSFAANLPSLGFQNFAHETAHQRMIIRYDYTQLVFHFETVTSPLL